MSFLSRRDRTRPSRRGVTSPSVEIRVNQKRARPGNSCKRPSNHVDRRASYPEFPMSMKPIVCKFGGTSVADASQLRKVQAIVESDPRRRVVVPSAPGKRVASDPKITDLLYLCHEMASIGTDFSGPYDTIRQRFLEIETQLGLNAGMASELDQLRDQLTAGCSRDFAASLNAVFVDPAEVVRIRSNGSVDPITYELLGARLSDPATLYVVPGFYGSDAHGNVKTFSRGGSDISGAIAARAANAELYENW